jgi:NAD+ diphosphatase
MITHGGDCISGGVLAADAGPTSPLRDRFAGLAFSGGRLNRLSEQRDDVALLARLEADPRALCVVIGAEMIAFDGDAPLHPFPERARFGPARETALLGIDRDGAPVFAFLLDDGAVEAVGEKDPAVSWDNRRLAIKSRPDLDMRDLRSVAVAATLAGETVAVLAQAKALMAWHARHRFCSNCGAPTQPAAAGWRRDCPACKAQHFPRTDPVVIMLAISPDGERCLLGRQARFPKSMHSALAGFVEAGETLEEAVRRELFEEAGLRAGAVAYLGSQPWPFPMNLMIGCLARARSETLAVDSNELEEARWFSREEAKAMLERRHADGLTAPQPVAIAHWLLRAWALDGAQP